MAACITEKRHPALDNYFPIVSCGDAAHLGAANANDPAHAGELTPKCALI